MSRLPRSAGLLAGLTLILACAAGSGEESVGSNVYRERIGQASAYDFSRLTRRILERFHYEVERSDSTENLHEIRTRWQHRYPFEDEQAIGATDAMTRFILRARSRGGSGTGASSLRVVELVAENQLLIQDTNAWRHGTMTTQFRDFVREIVQELKAEFSGVRVY